MPMAMQDLTETAGQPSAKQEVTPMDLNVAASNAPPAVRYAKCVEVSKRIRRDIERDVFRGRRFDYSKKFLPDGLSLVDQLTCLGEMEKRVLSQVQGRTYAYIFGLVERFINAKVLELSRDHWFGDQTALEA